MANEEEYMKFDKTELEAIWRSVKHMLKYHEDALDEEDLVAHKNVVEKVEQKL